MKYLQKISDFKVDIQKLKLAYFDIIEIVKEWSKDDPNLYDFNAICINQIPNDPNSIKIMLFPMIFHCKIPLFFAYKIVLLVLDLVEH